MRVLPLAIAFLSAFFIISATTTIVSAKVSYYGVSVNISDDGRSSVDIVLTPANGTGIVSLEVLGKVSNFNASSFGEPVICNIVEHGTTTISCSLESADTRPVQINFETVDFVKKFETRYLFSSDFSLDTDIDNMAMVVRLPEGSALIDDGTGTPGRLSFPSNATTSSDGRRIIVQWGLKGLSSSIPLKFEVFYENLGINPFFDQLRIRYFLAFGAAAGVGMGMFIFWRSRRSKQLVLSVLDEYERKVVDAITASGGSINQRKVVEQTNLSKAKVSRVVKSLEDRGVIEVERLGRTNKLKLVKNKFES